MKKLLIISLLACFAFAGCKKNDDPGFDYDRELLYGTWRVTDIFLEGEYVSVIGTSYEDIFEPTYLTFNSNGSYSGEGFFGDGSGRYKASGKTIIIYIGGEEFARYDVISLSDSEAEGEMYFKHDPADRMKFKVAKQ